MPALLIIGILVILGGLTLFIVWFEYLWELIKAILPLAIIGIGGIMAYFGWEEKKDRRGAFIDFSSPTEASRYQAEALAYQEKLSGFQEDSLASDPMEQAPPEDILEKVITIKITKDEPTAPLAAQESSEDQAPDLGSGYEGEAPPTSQETTTLEQEDSDSKTSEN
ncbi:MAG: hypothetical protein LBE38_00365 [Deltaproteobacteria bacterium]|jgi:hypothetical protein|nr:hypothetical protein [Deltaproteobacteria bacterium]